MSVLLLLEDGINFCSNPFYDQVKEDMNFYKKLEMNFQKKDFGW